MELTEEQRKIGIKYNIMTLISLDIHNKRYTELQQMYEMLQFAPSGGRKCVFQRPLCGAERPLVFS